MKHTIAIFLVILCGSLQRTHAQDLDSLLNRIRKDNKIPMLAVAAVKADTVLFLKAYGYRKEGDSLENVCTSDYVHIASNAKAMTGFLAARLVEEGRIKWDTKFFDLYPKLKPKAKAAYHPITLRDLLSHRGRFPPYTSGEEYAIAKRKLVLGEDLAKNRRAFVAYVLQTEPVQLDENINYVYSNAGYSAAAMMLEKVSGQRWEELMMKTFHTDMGLDIAFLWPNQINASQPWGHAESGDSLYLLRPTTEYRLEFGEPAGHVSMPMVDYVKFIQRNLKGLAGKDSYLKKETYEFLHFSNPSSYSIGWLNRGKDTGIMSEHKGTAGFFYCYSVLFPQKDVAYIVFLNIGESKVDYDVISLLMKQFQ